MNQEKIGKFISKKRKEMNLTQEDLAEKLGVSNRSISNWENGKCMPDLSLFMPLCDTLKITINELISGEELKSNLDEKLEENIINTINYSNKKISNKNNLVVATFIAFGVLLTLSAMSIFPSESSFGSLYAILGGIISLFGINIFLKRYSNKKRFFYSFLYFLVYMVLLIVIDYISVIYVKEAPKFSIIKETGDNMIVYKAQFYIVYRINYNSKNEYYIIDKNKKYTSDTVPITPFNRNKSGIDNIIKYKNKYVGNNSNDGSLIGSLPLSEYGYSFQIDSNNLGLIINYNISNLYINDDYLKQSLVYNSVCIFSLIDNVNYITFNFSGKTYNISKSSVVSNYPFYDKILSKNNFNKYLENKMNDVSFVNKVFNKLFS